MVSVPPTASPDNRHRHIFVTRTWKMRNSNYPEVEDIYDIENGDMNVPGEGFGVLNALGDFVNGMMSL